MRQQRTFSKDNQSYNKVRWHYEHETERIDFLAIRGLSGGRSYISELSCFWMMKLGSDLDQGDTTLAMSYQCYRIWSILDERVTKCDYSAH